MEDRYPLLVDVLRLLPGIRPVCERYRLGEAKLRASRSPKLMAYFNGIPLTLLQLEELFVYRERGGPRVSQEGAKLLLKLFDDGAFDRSDPRSVPGGLELLTHYSAGRASVIDYRRPNVRRARQTHDAKKRVEHLERKRVEHVESLSIAGLRNIVFHRLT
jgi:hypothetical protein